MKYIKTIRNNPFFSMKTKILNSKEITKKIALNELSYASILHQDEINEYLDIISAINNDEIVYNITTNKGEYLLFIKGDSVVDTKEKYKKS